MQKCSFRKYPRLKKPGLKLSFMSHAKACEITKCGDTIILIAVET